MTEPAIPLLPPLTTPPKDIDDLKRAVTDLYYGILTFYPILAGRLDAMIMYGPAADLPAADGSGRFYYATDSDALYFDDGAWQGFGSITLPIIDARNYGVTADGTTDDTAALQAAIDAIDPTKGGTILLPPGTIKLTDTIVIGDATDLSDLLWHDTWDSGHAYVIGDGVVNDSIVYICKANNTNQEPPNATYWTPISTSTVNSVKILGAGTTVNDGYGTTQLTTGTRIKWSGTAGVTMMLVNGPIERIELGRFTLNNGGAQPGICLDAIHPQNCWFHDLHMSGATNVCFRLNSSNIPPEAESGGASMNSFERMTLVAWNVGAHCLQVGGFTYPNNYADTFNVCLNSFRDIQTYGLNDSACLFGFADSNSFYDCKLEGLPAIECVTPSFADSGTLGDSGFFPGEFSFYRTLVADVDTPYVGITGDATWLAYEGTPPTRSNFVFFPWMQSDFGNPPPAAITTRISGFTDQGDAIGHSPGKAPLFWSLVTAPAAIANTTDLSYFGSPYTLAAYAANRVGTVIRLRAAMHYSAAAAVNLLVRFELGGLVIAMQTVSIPAAASDKSFTMERDLVVRAIGSSSTVQLGFSTLQLLGMGTSQAAYPGSGHGTISPDLTADNVVRIGVQWGTADSGNTITLDAFTVELLFPGTTT
jgi:hypothetical protein